MPKIIGVECKKCEAYNLGNITLCDKCLEFFCDKHIARHKDCDNGR